MSVDRSLTEIPTTLVFVKTPIFTGEVEALCFSIPIYDLVIGNIHALCSIKCKKQFSSNWRFAKASEVREMDGNTVQGDTVRTRAQQTRKNPSKWLVVPAGPGRNAREHLRDARWMHNICAALHQTCEKCAGMRESATECARLCENMPGQGRIHVLKKRVHVNASWL